MERILAMSDNAIVSLVLGGIGAVSWLLTLSYFLGRNTSKLDNLADAVTKMDGYIVKIFAKLEDLGKSTMHQCIQSDRVARLETMLSGMERRLSNLETWRFDGSAHRRQGVPVAEAKEGEEA